jgi:hypothetical protein
MRRLARNPAQGWLPHLGGSLSLLALAALLLVGTTLVSAQIGGGSGYDPSWWTVDGGGGTVGDVSSGYTLMSTAGQPDAAVILGDGGYTLVGGFWAAGATVVGGQEIYLPLIVRDFP